MLGYMEKATPEGKKVCRNLNSGKGLTRIL